MKLTIDTVEKTIVLEEDVSLSEFLSFVNDHLPSGSKAEYTIKRTKEYVVYPAEPYPVFPYFPIYPALPSPPWTITC